MCVFKDRVKGKLCVLMRFRGNGRFQLIFFIPFEMSTMYEEKKDIVGFG